jgi:hypothetical protein
LRQATNHPVYSFKPEKGLACLANIKGKKRG